MLAIDSMAKERPSIGARLEAGGLDDENYECFSDKVLRPTTAPDELAHVYEPQREGPEKVFPSFEKILSACEWAPAGATHQASDSPSHFALAGDSAAPAMTSAPTVGPLAAVERHPSAVISARKPAVTSESCSSIAP